MTRHQHDDISFPARGIVLGLVLSIGLWALVFLVVWWAMR